MHGTAQKNRGKEWLYYVCPVAEKRRAVLDSEGNLVACHARRVRAAEADGFVVDALRRFRLPDSALEAVRAELERRRKALRPGDLDRQRERLKRAEAAILEQHKLGYIELDDLQQEMTTIRRQLPPSLSVTLFSVGTPGFLPGDRRAPDPSCALLVDKASRRPRCVVQRRHLDWPGPAILPRGGSRSRGARGVGRGAPGRTRTADAGLRTASLCPLSYGGAAAIVPPREHGQGPSATLPTIAPEMHDAPLPDLVLYGRPGCGPVRRGSRAARCPPRTAALGPAYRRRAWSNVTSRPIPPGNARTSRRSRSSSSATGVSSSRRAPRLRRLLTDVLDA